MNAEVRDIIVLCTCRVAAKTLSSCVHVVWQRRRYRVVYMSCGSEDVIVLCTCRVAAKTILKALYDYEPRQSDDLGFRKGDRLELLSDRCVMTSYKMPCHNVVYGVYMLLCF